MPLIKSGSKAAVSKNISEFHTGKTYAHTKAKFGKARADAQAIAAALSTARRYGKKSGGNIAFDPEYLGKYTQDKTPNERVLEGHQEFEKGYAPSGRSPWNTDYPYRPILNTRGQELDALKIKTGGDVTGLAKAIDQAHRHHAPGQHPSTIKYEGKTYNLGKAFGGPNMENFVLRGAAYGLRREGMINSAIPGRTDKLPMSVRAGSYVIPSDIPSALGQGNSQAGGDILKRMFNSGPYGLPTMRGAGRPNIPRLGMRPISPKIPKGLFAEGGETEDDDGHIPIVAAGGEFLVSPEVVRDLGHGSLSAGHRVLDAFVLKVRKHHIATLKSLPPPKK